MNRSLLKFIVFIIAISKLALGQSPEDMNNVFQSNAVMFNIPADILKSIAYTESRVSHIIPDDSRAACSGFPHSYGIMGLRNDDWFGHSLLDAANLISATPQMLIYNYELNIRGAAALLSKYASEININRKNFNEWKPVLEKYSGIPQEDVKEFYSFDAFKVLSEGTNTNGVTIKSHAELDMRQFSKEINPDNKLINIQSDDYPPAVWDPSPNFTSLSINQIFAVVHDTEGSFAGAVSWLKNPAAQASTHYIIRRSDGYIVQLVREQDKAWHVRCWNGYMLGVEHEGYVSNPAYFTEAMYQSSAALFRHFVTKFGIPVDRNHIIGHNEWQNSQWVSWMQTNYPAVDPTCNTHTDPGQYWDWNYYMGLIAQDTTPPVVISHIPESNVDSVMPNTPIKIKFNKTMNKTVTQNAFSINPTINGYFTWEDLGQTLVFTPTALYALATEYNVEISATAASLFNVPLDSTFSFSFITKSYAPLNIETSYPVDTQQDISTTVKMIINFDTPLLQSSLSGNIFFQTEAGSSVSMKNAIYTEVNGKGVISFSPLNKLNEESNYKVILKSPLKNLVGGELGNDWVINFTTEKNNFVLGGVFDNFEAIKNWQDPDWSGSTVGTDPNLTSFMLSTMEKVDGSSSGKITYVFTGQYGVCRTFDGDKPNIGSNPDYKVGLWIYGDWSFNYLEYWFYYNTSTNVIVRVDTLDWTGWKFVEIPISSIAGSGDRLFHRIEIRQAPNGATSSYIYIDGAQYRDTSATSIDDELTTSPGEFYLAQNYPNPFNPSTTIRYAIPLLRGDASAVSTTLRIYDILGNEVATLVDEWKEAGSYSVNFNANKLSSGLYFYTLRAGNFSETKKLILMK